MHVNPLILVIGLYKSAPSAAFFYCSRNWWGKLRPPQCGAPLAAIEKWSMKLSSIAALLLQRSSIAALLQ